MEEVENDEHPGRPVTVRTERSENYCNCADKPTFKHSGEH